MNPPEFNPFDDLIVKDPRRPEAIVPGLNDRPLRILLAQFANLSHEPVPRAPRPAPDALLVISEQPGYGKSHLIGRLFRELRERATLVYVLPFQNPATVFQSLVLAITRELHFPTRSDGAAWDPEQPTQLDLLAHHLFAHLLADLIETRRGLEIDTEPDTTALLRADPLGAFNRGAKHDPWAAVMREHLAVLLPFFEEALERRGVAVEAAGAWLRVLFQYAWEPFDARGRRAALDWIAAQPLGEEELARLGLRPAQEIESEISPEAANELCRSRLRDLCRLASFFRPFVFCFDQTEIYGHQAALARSFGMVVAALVNEAPNHLTLVTSNQEPWVERIKPYLEDADRDRFREPAVTLDGLTRAQGEDLVRLRLATWQQPPEAAQKFLDPAWLAELFPTERNQMGARRFLQKCKERWARKPVAATSLAELYQEHREKLLAEPKRHAFEPDTLQWLVQEAARGLPDLEIEPLGSNYFSLRWTTPERACFFGFEGGTNWKRWQTIARNIQGRAERNPGTKAVFFRTPELPAIPGASWKVAAEIESAKAACLQMVALTVEDIAELYAAKELFADAAQGDIPFGTEQVIRFLHTQLAPWWERLRGPIGHGVPPVAVPRKAGDSNLAGQVREIVQRARFLSIDEVISQLAAPAVKDDVLKACGYSAEIKIHAHPNMTVLQWQGA
ncbi:MAG: hypothetical protein QOE70_2156 [Chthoniobacter sp.]|jgi:hypothetical protein|nr:hypothetical protein [Chthoniobacter sp.]